MYEAGKTPGGTEPGAPTQTPTLADMMRVGAEITSATGAGAVTRQTNAQFIDAYRASGGNLTGDLAGRPLFLVTMTGSRSGKKRTVPLAYVKDGCRIFIAATRSGADDHPVWFHNLMADPDVIVELERETYEAVAILLQQPERDAVFALARQQLPSFAEYEKRTTRVIPVFELVRRA